MRAKLVKETLTENRKRKMNWIYRSKKEEGKEKRRLCAYITVHCVQTKQNSQKTEKRKYYLASVGKLQIGVDADQRRKEEGRRKRIHILYHPQKQ